jgi:DNA-binding XRE family transcriptional regulator
MIKIREKITLKSCRITAGLRADEIADAAGVTVDTVYKWEKGRSFPNAPQVVKIIKYFEKHGYALDICDINFFDQ